MDDRHYLDMIYGFLAQAGKGVSSPKRIELLTILAQSPRTVDVLAHEANMTIANTSQHLRVLQKARMVESSKRGLFVTYRIADERVLDLTSALQNLAEKQMADIKQMTETYLAERELPKEIDAETAWQRVRKGKVTLLDVRPIEEYEAAHIDGALSVPIHTLDLQLAALPKNRDIIVYCRGSQGVLSMKAVSFLKKRGYRAVRLRASVREWQKHLSGKSGLIKRPS